MGQYSWPDNYIHTYSTVYDSQGTSRIFAIQLGLRGSGTESKEVLPHAYSLHQASQIMPTFSLTLGTCTLWHAYMHTYSTYVHARTEEQTVICTAGWTSMLCISSWPFSYTVHACEHTHMHECTVRTRVGIDSMSGAHCTNVQAI